MLQALILLLGLKLSHRDSEAEYSLRFPYETIHVGAFWNLFPIQWRFGIFQVLMFQNLLFVMHSTLFEAVVQSPA